MWRSNFSKQPCNYQRDEIIYLDEILMFCKIENEKDIFWSENINYNYDKYKSIAVK